MNWFPSLCTRLRKSTLRLLVRPAGSRLRPHVEALEDRCLPAAIAEYSTGLTGILGPITNGPDGNLWFIAPPTTSSSSQIISGGTFNYTTQNIFLGRITPTGNVTTFLADQATSTSYPLGYTDESIGLGSLTAGPESALWFTENTTSSDYNTLSDKIPSVSTTAGIGQISPTGVVNAFVASIPGAASNGVPTPLATLGGITTGPDGNLWFTESSGAIGRSTPAGQVTTFSTGITGVPTAITTGPDGNLWFTENNDRIGQITTSGVVTEFATGIAGVPTAITTGPDGNLWFTENNGRIGQITPTGVATEFIEGITGVPTAITAGQDGNLWFTENNGRLGQITPAGVVTEFTSGITGNPQSITVGPHGTLWFTEDNGKIGEVYDLLNDAQNYAEQLYESVLGRFGSSAELNYWANIQSQSGPEAVAAGIQGSDAAHTRLINQWFGTYLHRTVDAPSLQFFLNELHTQTEEQVLAQILASPEYLSLSAGVPGVGGPSPPGSPGGMGAGPPTDLTFLQATYLQLLGRNLQPAEITYWQGLESTLGRQGEVTLIEQSAEYQDDFIQSLYASLLHYASPATPTEVDYWRSLNLDAQSLEVAFELTYAFAVAN